MLLWELSLLPLASLWLQQPPSLPFHFLLVPSRALSKGRAFSSDLILFHTRELHLTWQVLGIQPGQEVPGMDQAMQALPEGQLCSWRSPSIHALPLTLHPACLRLFPLDCLPKSILMDFIRVNFLFSFYFQSFPTTHLHHSPSLESLPAPLPCIKALCSSQDCNLYNFFCSLCLIVSFVIFCLFSFSVHSEYPGWLK